MNSTATPTPAPAPGDLPPAGSGLRALMAPIALAIALGAAAGAAMLWQRADAVGREAARRLQQSDLKIAQLESQLQQSQEFTRELQSRAAVLENKVTESLGQQAQLERMYQSLAQDSIAAALADVENSVSIASQQLVVSGNVRGALVAMQDADGRLKRINQPEAIGLRRLIGRDIDRLRAVPNVDVIALALRLDAVSASLGQLPLASSVTPAATAAETPPEARQASGFSFERLASTGREGWRALVAELSQLFRVNRVDSPDALLLAPEQQYFVRENLRLTLLSARLALLARTEPLFRADVERAADWLEAYYDRRNRAVVNAIETLRQLAGSRISADLPSLGDTLAAVRTARAAREGTQ